VWSNFRRDENRPAIANGNDERCAEPCCDGTGPASFGRSKCNARTTPAPLTPVAPLMKNPGVFEPFARGAAAPVAPLEKVGGGRGRQGRRPAPNKLGGKCERVGGVWIYRKRRAGRQTGGQGVREGRVFARGGRPAVGGRRGRRPAPNRARGALNRKRIRDAGWNGRLCEG